MFDGAMWLFCKAVTTPALFCASMTELSVPSLTMGRDVPAALKPCSSPCSRNWQSDRSCLYAARILVSDAVQPAFLKRVAASCPTEVPICTLSNPTNAAALPSPLWIGSSDATMGMFAPRAASDRSEEHTSELQSRGHLVCRLLLEK